MSSSGLRGQCREVKIAPWVKNCLTRMQVAANRVNKEYTELANQGNRIQREVDAQTASCAQLSADNSARTSALKAAEASLATARADNARLARTAEATAARLRASEEKRTALEEQRDDLRCALLCRGILHGSHISEPVSTCMLHAHAEDPQHLNI